MRPMFTLIFAACLTLAACSDDDAPVSADSGKAPGSVGGPCYGNKTCNGGLVCLSDLCVRTDDMGPKKDGPSVKMDGPAVNKDGPAVNKDGPAVNKDGPAVNKDGPAAPDAAPKPCISGCVKTVAGNGQSGHSDGPALQALLQSPSGVALSSTGVLYIADRYNHRIRKLDNGKLTTLAGTGTKGLKDGAVSVAEFNEPYDLTVGSNGTIYVVERGNHTVRTISAGIVTTIAGTGKNGFSVGPALASKLNYPTGIALAGSGAIYLADKSNNRIRLLSSGTLGAFAGSGQSGLLNGPLLTAKFMSPFDIALASATKAYVADGGNNEIRLIDNAKVTTLAGDGVSGLKDGPALTARFSGPGSVVAGAAGKVYVSDYGNHAVRVIVSGSVLTLAGSGVKGFKDDKLTLSLFKNPMGIVVDGKGRVYVADSGNHRIRLVIP